MALIEKIIARAQSNPQRIVLPESLEDCDTFIVYDMCYVMDGSIETGSANNYESSEKYYWPSFARVYRLLFVEANEGLLFWTIDSDFVLSPEFNETRKVSSSEMRKVMEKVCMPEEIKGWKTEHILLDEFIA